MKISLCLRATPSRSSRSLSSAVFYYYLLQFIICRRSLSFLILFLCAMYLYHLADPQWHFADFKKKKKKYHRAVQQKIQFLNVKKGRDLSQAAFIWLIVSYHRSMNEGTAIREREKNVTICMQWGTFCISFLTATTITHSFAALSHKDSMTTSYNM